MSTEMESSAIVLTGDEWPLLLAEILPQQGGWTKEQYLVLTDHRNRLVEFSNGVLEPLSMPTDRHQAILLFLTLVFHQFVKPKGGKVRFSPLRLQVAPEKFREPDLLLLRSAGDPRGENRYWTGADLTLEVVSDDKPERDLVQKRGEYAEAGVPEYWIVNPQTETITVLTLKEREYVEAGCHLRGEQAVSILLAGFAVDVAAVFDAE
jgi:Uma2 family endonuclease